MRITLNGVAAICLSVAVCVACSKKVEKAETAPAKPAGVQVTAVGCPEVGPAPNCLSIKANGKSYDLAGANPPVDVTKGVGVSIRAMAGEASTPCGIILTDVKVEYLGLQCGPPPAPPAAAPAT